MNKKIKNNIILVANYESDVGYAWWLMETYWAAISNNFFKKKYKSFLIYPKINKKSSIIDNSKAIVIELDFSDRTVNGLKRIRNFVINNSVKYIYLTDGKIFDYLYGLLRIWGVKRIVNHDHTPGERQKPILAIIVIKKILHMIGIFSCDHYIGVSYFVYKRLINNGCIDNKKCSFIHNGIEPIKTNYKNKDYLNRALSIPMDRIIVVSVGRATYYKGIDFIIKCANEIININKIKNVCFLHCGDGPDLASFKNLTKFYMIDNYFIFLGKRDDVRLIIPHCHIGMQATVGEAFSLAILEYQSAGLATIAPNNCGNSEAIEDGINGFLYKPYDLFDAVRILLRLIYNQSLREKIGNSAKETINKNFNINLSTKKLVRRLEKIFE